MKWQAKVWRKIWLICPSGRVYYKSNSARTVAFLKVFQQIENKIPFVFIIYFGVETC